MRSPVVPTLYSVLIDKALKISPDEKVITLKRFDIIQHEQQVREYYRALNKGKERDFYNLNSFMLLFYREAAPKNIEGRYFRVILACFLHAHRDYLLSEGVTRLNARNNLKSAYFSSRLIRPYFPTLSASTFNGLWFTFCKTEYVKHVPDYLPIYRNRRKFIKAYKYYQLSAEAEAIITQFHNDIKKQYMKTLATLRAEAHLLHVFNEIPVDLRTLTKAKRKRYKKQAENIINDLNTGD